MSLTRVVVLAARAHFLRWANGISFLVVILVILGGVVLGLVALPAGRTAAFGTLGPGALPTGAAGAPLPAPAVAGGCVVGVAFLALLVFGLMTLRVIYGMGKVFREQAELARVNWSGVAVARPAG